jgi:sugar lactone lactonase YvrE
MPRTLALLAASAALLLAGPASAQPRFNTPKTYPPDAATLKQIEAMTAELRKAIAALPKNTAPDIVADVAVYAKAAEWIVRHGEFYQKDSAKQTLAVLDAGLKRAKAAVNGKAPWRDVRGKPIIRGYRSHVDDSYQPYSVTLPEGFGRGDKKWRMDTVLHGRNQSLTEVSFIAGKEAAKPAAKPADYIVLEPYGRGNNAYRWAGEEDVLDAISDFVTLTSKGEGVNEGPIDLNRLVLRGFSMGGAGTWHIGLHHPFANDVIGPGAGFTSTHGYIKNLPARLPDYQEKCLRIYDAVDYAENAFNVPVVAYSGANDPQKAAADNIEAALKGFPLPLRFTHLVAPGLQHKMPPEWQAKAEAEYRKYLADGKNDRQHVRFVTYTTRYNWFGHGWITGLDRHYTKAVVDSRRTKEGFVISTTNVRAIQLPIDPPEFPATLTIDGQRVAVPKRKRQPAPKGKQRAGYLNLRKRDGRWELYEIPRGKAEFAKTNIALKPKQGPIDDAFMNWFRVSAPSRDGWYPAVTNYATASLSRFGTEWDKFFRGHLPILRADEKPGDNNTWGNLVLFGDPASNPLIAKIVEKLPIMWTKDTLVVNGVKYDPKTHVPVLIYPNPLNPSFYVVINSGHTFHAADFRGTNALLYPRLGDWAVLKPTPTKNDPAAAEVVAAGLFDEFWQFAKADKPEQKSFVAPGAKLEKLWGEGEFTEGPTPGPDGAIYFSDIGDRIMKFDPKSGKTTTFRDPSGRSNGLKFDAKGRLVACEGANTGGNRRISITETDGTVRTLADKWKGKRFNSPNDLTIDSKGRVYFTDPRYVGTEPREIDTDSVYRVDPDGTVTRVIADVTKPNGIAISPDGKTLYLAENNGDPKKPRQLLAYPLKADGTVGAKKVLYDFGTDRGIDGMAVTSDGLIAATAGKGKTAGVWFFSPEGKKLGVVPTPEDPSNCCFGGPGSETLYITAGKSLYRVKLTVHK